MTFRIQPLWAALWLTLPALTVPASDACACTIPVFRYALDRWEADRFSLALTEAAAQDSAVSNLLRPLRASGHANLSITTEPALSQIELRTSRLGGQTLWSGALDAASLASLLDSPARQQILKHILAGDSVIWVLATDDSAAENAAADRIEQRLRFLENVAALPIQDPNDPDSQLGPGPPLLLKFTALRLNRKDPAEGLLLKMLAGPNPTFDPGSTGFAAAVFGRGRVLASYALTELDDPSLEEACMFLIGRCSCRVKDQNPGWDILMNVEWDQALKKAAASPPSANEPPAAPAKPAAPEPVIVKTKPQASPDASTDAPASPSVRSLPLSTSTAIAGALALLIGFLFLRKK